MSVKRGGASETMRTVKVKTSTTREHELEVSTSDVISALRSAGYPIPDGREIRVEDPRYAKDVQVISSVRLRWTDFEVTT